MSRNELVSIIIPNYNHARYLGEAIESVIAQTYAPRFVIERRLPGLIHTDGETHVTGARVEVAVQPHSS